MIVMIVFVRYRYIPISIYAIMALLPEVEIQVHGAVPELK